jgi:drug/metabolite transporter (DMT)-like permease
VRNVEGAIWIVLACVFFTTMSAIAKLLGEGLHPFQVAFGRAFFGLAILAPFILVTGPSQVLTSRWWLHVTRAALGTGAMLSGFYAITHLPLAEATALSFTKPLFQVLLAAFFLHEVVRLRRWSATAAGFLGVLVMVRPTGQVVDVAILVGLLGALLSAFVAVTIRELVRTERPLVILFYLGVVGSTISGSLAAPVWQPLDLAQVGLMVLMAAVGSVGQLCVMRGFRLGEASAMAPFDYTRLPISALYGLLLFSETPGLHTVVGAAIIAGSTLYIARREAVLAKGGAPPGG